VVELAPVTGFVANGNQLVVIRNVEWILMLARMAELGLRTRLLGGARQRWKLRTGCGAWTHLLRTLADFFLSRHSKRRKSKSFRLLPYLSEATKCRWTSGALSVMEAQQQFSVLTRQM
jgi:hypothetical protein